MGNHLYCCSTAYSCKPGTSGHNRNACLLPTLVAKNKTACTNLSSLSRITCMPSLPSLGFGLPYLRGNHSVSVHYAESGWDNSSKVSRNKEMCAYLFVYSDYMCLVWSVCSCRESCFVVSVVRLRVETETVEGPLCPNHETPKP